MSCTTTSYKLNNVSTGLAQDGSEKYLQRPGVPQKDKAADSPLDGHDP